MVLLGNAALQPVQDVETTRKAKPQTDRLNAYLLNLARGSGEVASVASPVTGGGVPVTRFQQLLLLGRAQGQRRPEEWANYCWQVLASQNQRVLKDGKTLIQPEENIAELTRQAHEFAEKRLPILKALEIA